MGFLLDKAHIKHTLMLAPFYEKIIDRKEQLKVEHVLVHVFLNFLTQTFYEQIKVEPFYEKIRSVIFSMFCLHQNTQAGTLFWHKHKPLVKHNV